MKIIRFNYQDFTGLGLVDKGKVFTLLDEKQKSFNDMNDFLKSENVKENITTGNSYDLSEVTILSPFEYTKHDVLCVGLNYSKHIEEAKKHLEQDFDQQETAATYFSKRTQDISYHMSTIAIDDNVQAFDYETELGVIIGKKGKNIEQNKALDHIFGFTIVNDYSDRILQKKHTQWYKGKSLDGFTSIGPMVVTIDEFDFPLNLDLKTFVNDEIRQDSNTSYMIRDVQRLVSELSQGMTLVPGDIIATGTPEGVGMGFSPAKYLKKGDKVESFIEGIGSLINIVE